MQPNGEVFVHEYNGVKARCHTIICSNVCMLTETGLDLIMNLCRTKVFALWPTHRSRKTKENDKLYFIIEKLGHIILSFYTVFLFSALLKYIAYIAYHAIYTTYNSVSLLDPDKVKHIQSSRPFRPGKTFWHHRNLL